MGGGGKKGKKHSYRCTSRLPVQSTRKLRTWSRPNIRNQDRETKASPLPAVVRVIAAQRRMEQATGMWKQWQRRAGMISTKISWVSHNSICSTQLAKLNQARPHPDWYRDGREEYDQDIVYIEGDSRIMSAASASEGLA